MFYQTPLHVIQPVAKALIAQVDKVACVETSAVAKSQGVTMKSCKALSTKVEGQVAVVKILQHSVDGKTFRVTVKLNYGWNVSAYVIQ